MILEPFKGKFPSILVFGAPGVGKGTLCKFLASSTTLYHLSSGDIFRGISPSTPAGQLFSKYAHKGLLVPDDVTIAIWDNYVQGLISTNKYFPTQQYLMLDGIPRTVPQAKMIEEFISIKAIIVLEVKDQSELTLRLKRRALLEKRVDDADETVLKTRMEVYEKETERVLHAFDQKLIHRINGQQRPLEVVRDVLDKLSNILAYVP